MDTINYTEEEQKQIGLLLVWVKLSKVGGNFGKQATKTFSKDWIKLQEDFVDRLGLEGGRVYINKTMNLIEDYILEVEEKEVDTNCCKTCEQTDIEICYDCGECADSSLPNRCCECEEEDLK